MSRKLKELTGSRIGEFEIIDDWNHQWVEDLPWDKAIAKYGECEVDGTYTAANSQYPDDTGKTPSWKVAVWIKIPGMKIGVWNNTNKHLRFVGNLEEATFIGKKSGQLITVHKYGHDDYSAWWRDASERNMENRGFSVRGTAKEIIEELEGEI